MVAAKSVTSSSLVEIVTRDAVLAGDFTIPRHAKGLVIFAHGSGSSRTSPRNQYVAQALHARNIGTLLMDLLTEEEVQYRSNVFDIEFLSTRVLDTIEWISTNAESAGLQVGLFGASTGAAAALIAAAECPKKVFAVVSRGGRPDLANELYLVRVKAPTLLIVGSNDYECISLNKDAYNILKCTKNMILVPGATHLFSEPGTLEEVSRLAAEWFERHLIPAGSN